MSKRTTMFLFWILFFLFLCVLYWFKFAALTQQNHLPGGAIHTVVFDLFGLICWCGVLFGVSIVSANRWQGIAIAVSFFLLVIGTTYFNVKA